MSPSERPTERKRRRLLRRVARCGIIPASWARSSMAEQLTLNQRVEGSSPSGLTMAPHDMTPVGTPPGVDDPGRLPPASWPHRPGRRYGRRSGRPSANPTNSRTALPGDGRRRRLIAGTTPWRPSGRKTLPSAWATQGSDPGERPHVQTEVSPNDMIASGDRRRHRPATNELPAPTDSTPMTWRIAALGLLGGGLLAGEQATSGAARRTSVVAAGVGIAIWAVITAGSSRATRFHTAPAPLSPARDAGPLPPVDVVVPAPVSYTHLTLPTIYSV